MDCVSTSAPIIEDDEWDADGFEIPSLKIGKDGAGKTASNGVNDPLKKTPQKANLGTEKIYLGPHGAPPSQLKEQETITSGRKQRLKQKLKDAEKKGASIERENKVEVLRDLMGSKGKTPTSKGGQNDWLDPHCHEIQFERSL